MSSEFGRQEKKFGVSYLGNEKHSGYSSEHSAINLLSGIDSTQPVTRILRKPSTKVVTLHARAIKTPITPLCSPGATNAPSQITMKKETIATSTAATNETTIAKSVPAASSKMFTRELCTHIPANCQLVRVSSR
jgi:hypothetical protein